MGLAPIACIGIDPCEVFREQSRCRHAVHHHMPTCTPSISRAIFKRWGELERQCAIRSDAPTHPAVKLETFRYSNCICSGFPQTSAVIPSLVNFKSRSLSDIAFVTRRKRCGQMRGRRPEKPEAIHWNTLRIFQGRERRRWSWIIRRSRTVNVGQAREFSTSGRRIDAQLCHGPILAIRITVPVMKRIGSGSANRRKGSCYENEAVFILSCFRHWTRGPDGPPRDRRSRDHPAIDARHSDGDKHCRRSSDDRRDSRAAQ